MCESSKSNLSNLSPKAEAILDFLRLAIVDLADELSADEKDVRITLNVRIG